MATLYLIEQNTVLRKSGKRLLFCKRPPGNRRSPGVRQGDILIDLPCEDVDHVMIFGNVQLTTQVMHQLLTHGIETAIFSWHGRLLGQLTPPAGKNIVLRQAQFQKYDDIRFRLEWSKALVDHKIHTSLQILRGYLSNHPGIFSTDELQSIERIRAEVNQTQTLTSLLGQEGAASAIYFRLLGRMLPEDWQFDGRSRRPPLDAPNAVLSFGYTIVGSELQALLDGTGFDPYLGFYHEIHYGRPSLALDLLEIFRHAFVDRLMLRLFNLGILQAEDFAPVAKKGIYLITSGKKKFFRQYEKMAGGYRGETLKKDPGGLFRRAFQAQVQALIKTIMNDAPIEIGAPVN